MNITKLILLGVFLSVFSTFIIADEIVKKSGEVIQGKIEDMKQDEFVRINVEGKLFQFKWEDIDSFKVSNLTYKTHTEFNKTLNVKLNGHKPSDERSPFLAAVLSLTVSGLGQVYNGNGDELKGAIMFSGSVFCWIMFFDSPTYFSHSNDATGYIWLVGAGALNLFSVVDAIGGANYINDKLSLNVSPKDQKLCLNYKIDF